MTPHVTREMVFLYKTNDLSPKDRQLVEREFQRNINVRNWFRHLDLLPATVKSATGDIDIGLTARELASRTSNDHDRELYQRLNRSEECLLARAKRQHLASDENDATLLGAVRKLFDPASKQPIDTEPLVFIGPGQMLVGRSGEIAYRVPQRRSADQQPRSMLPIAIPCIVPDVAGGRLTIRKLDADLGHAVVNVWLARLTEPAHVDRFGPLRVELEPMQRVDGSRYWHKQVSVRSLVKKIKQGDLFYVVPANNPDCTRPAADLRQE